MPIRSQYGSQDLSAGEFDKDFTFGKSSKLQTVYVHATVPIIETIEITYKAAKSSNFDTLIETEDLETESDFVFMAEGSIAIEELDAINVNVSNANATGTVYVTVKSEIAP